MKYTKLAISSTLAIVEAGGLLFAPLTFANSNESKGNFKTKVRAATMLNWRANWSGDFTLVNTIKNDIKVNGKATVKRQKNSLYATSLHLRAENFPPSVAAASVYEAWLVDSETNAKLSLGAFTLNSKGKADIHFTQQMNNPIAFDKLIISREAQNDINPNPGEVIFSADLKFSVKSTTK